MPFAERETACEDQNETVYQVYNVGTDPSSYLQSLVGHPTFITATIHCATDSYFASLNVRYASRSNFGSLGSEMTVTMTRLAMCSHICFTASYPGVAPMSLERDISSARPVILTKWETEQSFISKKSKLTSALLSILGHRLLHPLRLCFRYQARLVLVSLIDLCHSFPGCYRGLVVVAVTNTSDKGGITEDLRNTCEQSRSKKGRVRESMDAHVCTGGSHPRGLEGQLKINRRYRKSNRNDQLVECVERLACSCRENEMVRWCELFGSG